MKKFVTNLVQLMLLATLVVLLNNYTYAGTINSSEDKDLYGEKLQKLNFPNQLYFEQFDFKTVNGISKNKIPDLKPGNSFLFFCNSYKDQLYFKSIPPSCQDLQYTLKIQIFPSHYFW